MKTCNLEHFTCPRCDAFDRERLIALYLDRVCGGSGHGRRYSLLEFAPGEALQKKLQRLPYIEYQSADLSRKTVDHQVDLTAMVGYGDRSLDILLCSHVLEHIPDDAKAMRVVNCCG